MMTVINVPVSFQWKKGLPSMQAMTNQHGYNGPFALVDHVINFRETQKQFAFEKFC